MADKIDPISDEVWAVGNAALDAKAGIDTALMRDEDWAKLEDSSARLQAAALELGRLDPVVVVLPGVKIADEGVEGGNSAADVQKYIDADPQGMRDMAQTLAAHMGELVAAAKARDAGRAGPLIDQLDGVCEACHLEFWYPGQKALVGEVLRKDAEEETKAMGD